MAQIKTLKLVSGKRVQHDSAADDITFLSGNFGNIQVSANAIISTDTNGDLALTPDGTGDLVLDGVNWPQADGTANQILKTDGAGQTSWTDAFAENTADLSNFVAGATTVNALEPVYISAANTVQAADASAESTSRVIGFAQNTATVGNAVQVQMNGVLGGFTGLTAGATYFLSETTGAITATPVSTNNAENQPVGIAASTTELMIMLQPSGEQIDTD